MSYRYYMRHIVICFFLTLTVQAHAIECVLTIPKTGTNLLIKCVMLITEKNRLAHIPKDFSTLDAAYNQSILWGHFWLTDESPTIGPTSKKVSLCQKHNIKIFLLKRDPRDLVCALARLCFEELTPENLRSVIEYPGLYISKIIGTHSHSSQYDTFHKLYSEYLKWESLPNVYLASFENLVGPEGGGSREEQLQEIHAMANFLGIDLDPLKEEEIADQLFGATPTFQRGQSGAWKEYWTPELLDLFIEREGDLIEKMATK